MMLKLKLQYFGHLMRVRGFVRRGKIGPGGVPVPHLREDPAETERGTPPDIEVPDLP